MKEYSKGIYVKFKPEEVEMIHERMKEAGAQNMSAFIRKMVLNGYMIIPEWPDLDQVISLHSKPIGINKKLIKDMKKNFVNQFNNPDKMSPTLYLSIEEIEYEGMTLLWFFVPPTSTVEKCANRIYDRNEDGDMDITDSPIQLQNLYNRKSNTYAERKIFPYVTTADLRLDLLEKVRNLAKSKKPGIEGKYR